MSTETEEKKNKMTRRSYRLKNKPSPNYVYDSNYFKLAIRKMGEDDDDFLDEDEESTVQLSAEETKKKYDDIFSAVVANAFMMDAEPEPKVFKKNRQCQKRKRSEGDSDKTSTDDDDDVIIVLEKKKKETIEEDDIIEIDIFGCPCGVRFENHSDCHKHIAEEHGDNELNIECLKCGHRLSDIRAQNICHICGKYCEQLEEHVVSHYRISTAKMAAMECRFCTKQFITVKEVMEHEKQKHTNKNQNRPRSSYGCNECGVELPSYDVLSHHYATHFDVNLMFDKIADIQIKHGVEKEDCPFCRRTIASKKVFRSHVFNKHYLAAISLIRSSSVDEKMVADAERVKQEIEQMLIDFPDTSDVKQEVKEEVHDDEYPNQ